MKHLEDSIQKAICAYIDLQYPNILYTAIPGGMFSSPSQGAKMKSMGYRPGTPDLFILEPRRGKHALLLELKKEDGYAQDNQVVFKYKANNRGYESRICYGFDQAKEIIDSYLTEEAIDDEN